MLRLYGLAIVAIVVVVCAELACDQVPLTSPTGSSISITSDRNVLPLNGQATLHAVVIESAGTPVQNGTVVNFTTTLGTVDPTEAKTVNGIATAMFNAGGISGTTVIHAFSGGSKTGSGNSSSGGVEIKIGAAAAGGISLSATPPSVSQSGGTVTVSALVLDPSGNPLPGVNVTFSANAGALSNTIAITDSTGFARTQLTTTTTATVTAAAGSATKDVTVTVTAAPTVTITAADTGTEGVPVPITVAVGSNGNNSPRQIQTLVVDFGDGFTETRSNVTGTVGFSHTYSQARGYTITATAIDVGGNTGTASKPIVISAAALPTVSVSATPNPVPSGNNGLTTFTVTATAGSSTVPLRNVTVRNMTSAGEIIYSGTGGGSFAHRFGGTGTYTIQATATDANGNTGTSSTVVVVQ
jgi:adhesin/invasin